MTEKAEAQLDELFSDPVFAEDEELQPEDEFLVGCTQIEISRIDEEMSRLHAEMARWHARYSDAFRVLLQAELETKREEARLYLVHAQEPGPTGRSPAVELIKARVRADPAWSLAQGKYIDARIEHDRLQGICKTVSKKADMLVGINNRINAELRHNAPLAASS